VSRHEKEVLMAHAEYLGLDLSEMVRRLCQLEITNNILMAFGVAYPNLKRVKPRRSRGGRKKRSPIR